MLRQFEEVVLVGDDVPEEAQIPHVLVADLLARVAEQLRQEWIDVRDFAGLGIEDQDAVLGRLEEAAIAQLGGAERLVGRFGGLAPAAGGTSAGARLARSLSRSSSRSPNERPEISIPALGARGGDDTSGPQEGLDRAQPMLGLRAHDMTGARPNGLARPAPLPHHATPHLSWVRQHPRRPATNAGRMDEPKVELVIRRLGAGGGRLQSLKWVKSDVAPRGDLSARR